MKILQKVRNKVNRMNINLKRQYFSDKSIQTDGNMEETWKRNKQLLIIRSKFTNIDLVSDQGTYGITKIEISNAMNKHFCSVGRDLAGKIDKCPNPLLSGDYDINSLTRTFVVSCTVLSAVSLKMESNGHF